MDAIANGPFWQLCGFKETSLHKSTRAEDVFGKDLWKQILDLYEDDIEDGPISFDFWAYTFLRVMAASKLLSCTALSTAWSVSDDFLSLFYSGGAFVGFAWALHVWLVLAAPSSYRRLYIYRVCAHY